jgi:branched-chain amino acid transport system substrate-binding protein
MIAHACLVLVLVLACLPSFARGDDSIKIGVISSLDAIGASWSTSANLGLREAASEINQRGGVNGRKLELIFEDDRFDPKRAVSAYRSLRSREVEIFIGPQFEQTLSPVIPIAAREGSLVVTTIASTPLNKEPASAVIHSVPTDRLAARCLADAIKRDGRKRVAFIMPQESYSQTFATFVKESLDGIALQQIDYVPERPDYNALILRTRQLRPDAVVFFFVTAEAAIEVFRRLEALDVDVPVYSNEVLHESKAFLEQAAPRAFGTRYCGINFNADKAEIRAFLRSLPERPILPLYSVIAYDTLHWLARALEESGGEVPSLRKAVSKVAHKGLLTEYSFDPLGDLQYDDFTVFEVTSGGFRAVALP